MTLGKSGYFDIAGSDNYTLRVHWEERYDIIANQSIVSITKAEVKHQNRYGVIYYLNGHIYVDGVAVVEFDSFAGTHKVTLPNPPDAFVSVVGNPPTPWDSNAITHNDDGSKNVVISADVTGYTTSGKYGSGWNTTGSNTIELTTIPRASDMIVEAGVLGDTQLITVSRVNDSFTHDITYSCGAESGTICVGSESEAVPFTLPLFLASQNTSGTTVEVTFSLQTYLEGASVGSPVTKTVNMAIPDSVKPKCDVTIVDSLGYLDIYGAYVKGLSNLVVSIDPTLAYGSDIVSYKTTIGESTYLGSEFTVDSLTSTGDLIVSSVVTDKRSRVSDPDTEQITVLDYTPPAIAKLTVHRCVSNGTPDDQGEYVQVVFSASVTPLNDLNDAEYILYYKKSKDSTYTGIALDNLYGSYSVKDYTYIFPAEGGSSYDVQIAVEDNHFGTTRSTSVSTAFTLMHFNAEGTGVGIGKISEKPNAVEFGVPTYDRYGQFESVVEGNSGIWYYRKWLNGNVELWGEYTVSNMECKTALGGLYRTPVFTTPAFPFKVYYSCTVASYESEGYGAMLWATTTTTESRPPSYYLIRPVSGTIVSGKIVFHIKGRWET